MKLVELSPVNNRGWCSNALPVNPLKRAGLRTGKSKFDEVAGGGAARGIAQRHPGPRGHALAMPQSAVITKKIMLPAGLREEELELCRLR